MVVSSDKSTRILKPAFEIPKVGPTFMAVAPPINPGGDNRAFFQDYRNEVLARFTPPVYKWGADYMPYTPRPELVISHRKQRWEEMLAKPEIPLTFCDAIKKREIDDFYLLCQFQRQYYNDYTHKAHPLDYFQRDVHRWSCPPDLNRTYIQSPQYYVKYKKPVTLPLTLKKTWAEPFEPCRRLAGKYETGPDNKYGR